MFGYKNAKEIISLMAIDLGDLTDKVEKLEKSHKRLEKRLDNLNCEHLNQCVRVEDGWLGQPVNFKTICTDCEDILSVVSSKNTTRSVQEVKMYRNMIKLLEDKIKKEKGK